MGNREGMGGRGCFVVSGRGVRVGGRRDARCARCGPAVPSRVVVRARFVDRVDQDAETEDLRRVVKELQVAPGDEGVGEEFAYSLLDAMKIAEPEMDQLSMDVFTQLKNRGVLTGFGAFESRDVINALAEREKGRSVSKFAEISNVPVQALAPKRSTVTAWQAAGVGSAVALFLFARVYHVDMYAQLLGLGAIGAFALDQALLRGSLFQALYRVVAPQYREKVLRHEAGHLMVAYMLGCPVRGYVIDAYQALLKGIPGQAGTIFTDARLMNELQNNKLTQRSIDRYSIVVMGGIAAEALHYGQAEGGQSDERALINLLGGLRPPWAPKDIITQAWWSAQCAILLLQQQQAAFEALVVKMEEGAPLGECIRAIEANVRPAVPLVPDLGPAPGEVAEKPEPAAPAPEDKEAARARQSEHLAKREQEIADRLKEIDRLLGEVDSKL